MTGPVVVIGGGLAGAKTVEALRDKGFDGSLTLVCAEDVLPYERPPLSKDYLLGKAGLLDSTVHDEQWYADRRVDVRLGVSAVALDPAQRVVTLSDGTSLDYSSCVLATGSEPVGLDDLPPGVAVALRTAADAEALKAQLAEGGRWVIAGGGWIGLEVAAAARAAGCEVTVVLSSARPLQSAIGPVAAEVFLELHLAHGVRFRPEHRVTDAVVTDGRLRAVLLEDGEELPADRLLVAVGARPRLDLAVAAGLEVGDGVRVGPDLRTSDPHIWAVGDIAEVNHPVLGRPVRVEHWAWALHQPAVAAASILGQDAAFDDLPYFFSDQYDLGMEFLGDPHPDDRLVLRGDRDGREFVGFLCGADDVVHAVIAVNVWDVPDAVRDLIIDGRPVDPARLADEQVPLAEL
ncbi:NAD(P)/FAD-dependent oxidoreductase [Nakamurella sp. YIM 132087]|uniref:NAD(P)/FAD-dependent oxidoreductase n=1 Tax=Nakamurella alba TaxID=2665158 RepID=A0A7K1FJK9_9ACTN|nr:FAD-dependent oxidoreductase [Nakamurella alba]MTD13054.1 NAD(P)/FAD-dependent oxidoreductase [Nakamurella alba]